MITIDENSVNDSPDSEQDSGNATKRTLRTRQTAAQLQSELALFMADFDPEKSRREKMKTKRKISSQQKFSAYNEKGHIRINGVNVCDCLDGECPGCFYPCSICKNCKCGPSCRMNRKTAYDMIEFDGNNDKIPNNFVFMKK